MTSHCAHGEICVLLVFLYDFVCLFSACCFCHFRVVLLLCCVPPVLHPPPPPHSDPKTWHSRCSRLWCCLLSFLPSFLPSSSSSSPLSTLRASSHIHLPVLCLCLSILWCDPRRHGLTKLDELRSVPSSFSPSFSPDRAFSSSALLFILYI